MVQVTSVHDDADRVEIDGALPFSPERVLEIVSEKWGLLIFREALFNGTTEFADFEQNLAVPSDILVARLDGFVASGLMNAQHAEGDTDESQGHKGDKVGNDFYTLTAHGRNLAPVIVALAAWSDDWPEPDPSDGASRPLLIEFSLLGSFSVRVDGHPISAISVGSQRLLVFLALHDRAVTRAAMAGTMWPDATDERAGISLRSALSRLDPVAHEAILSASAGLSLAAAVSIDYRDAQSLARRLTSFTLSPTEEDLEPAAVATLSAELLPDWFDDWVLSEAEDWRQLRMNALEALAGMLTDRGRLAEAAGVARAAMKVEPLRESAHACLIRVHLAKGNQSEALRVFERYCELLKNVLDLEPTAKLTNLVAGLLPKGHERIHKD